MIGRFANRLAGGRFYLDERSYTLATNNTPGGRPCHLHGGPGGFDRRLWSATPFTTPAGEPALRLVYRSPDGEEGYPGTLDVTVTYTLGADATLRLDTVATTDAPTILNLTNHSYFNLAGAGSPTSLDHELVLHATAFTPVDAGLIPTGVVAPVAGTPLDFTTPQRIGARIDAPHEQLRFAGGYDHNFVLAPSASRAPRPAATLRHADTGRVLDVLTTEPGLQFYSGNFLDGSFPAKAGRTYPHRSGLCLETQHFPDSPNQPAFPSTVLRPGETFRSTTLFRFSTA
jgi:aldose 1-epimerase